MCDKSFPIVPADSALMKPRRESRESTARHLKSTLRVAFIDLDNSSSAPLSKSSVRRLPAQCLWRRVLTEPNNKASVQTPHLAYCHVMAVKLN